MRLTDLNREGGIGSNSLLVEIGEFRLLVDAGLHPKHIGNPAMPRFERIGDTPLDFVFLTHCHLDHLGSIPVLLRGQPQASVLMTAPSRMIAPRMLHNSCNVMMRQRAELGIQEYPLFTHGEVDRCESRFSVIPYEEPRLLRSGRDAIEVTYFHAGHIVGAAGIRMVHKHRRILFTGDVLFAPQRTIGGALFPDEPVDTLIMETTRGASPRSADYDREKEIARLVDTIGRTLAHGGNVMIPVFALGRMQEMLAILHDAVKRRLLPRVPIFCGGLGVDLASYFDEIAKRTGLVNFRHKILKELKVRALPEYRPGRPPGEKGIHLLSSGMMVENTPSYAACASLLADSHSTICFVGYCDPETPGGELLASKPGETFLFKVLDYTCPVRAKVERFDLSGHADRDELVDFAVRRNPRSIVLTHGDPEARAWFKEQLETALPKAKVLDPVPLETYVV